MRFLTTVLLGGILLVGCVGFDDPLTPEGKPRYSVSETVAQTAGVVEETSDAFANGFAGGGLVSGIVAGLVAAFFGIKRRKEKQDALLDDLIQRRLEEKIAP
jgi:hypothetical protein